MAAEWTLVAVEGIGVAAGWTLVAVEGTDGGGGS